MKLEQAFCSLQERNPYWSSLTCLASAVMGKNYGKMEIGRVFDKRVEKDDYPKSEKDDLKKFLANLATIKFETNAKK